ncbi:MAG: DUF423 domain-containing protein [Bacteroidota bacterium]|nr:DUF423 domain-containing protein [Bacteroidota bacterium]MDX5427050.1 DUF423 domain-containing protein [Bacteroidota bacterium]MDX5447640.1 DUF423 domain-containing protein [Bacteroidota bacterium]MDX5505027.1 DUF423 domain-containing protein [Bacteroidota bacterium]
MKPSTTLLFAAFLGGTAIVLGALGAHALKPILDPGQIESYLTAVRYQLFSAFFLLFLGITRSFWPELRLGAVAMLALLGGMLFSFSIYILLILKVNDISGTSIVGPITPIGGLLMISAWVLLFIELWKKGGIFDSTSHK